jgi:hypothetical protein
MAGYTVVVIVALLGLAEAPPTTAPTRTTAPASRPTLSEPALTIDRFFDALRRRDLDAARAMCWVPRDGIGRHFDREMPAESEKLASGKRVVAVLDGHAIGDLGIIIFNEDTRDKGNFAGKLEPLWVVRQGDQWKVNVAPYKTLAAEFSEDQRVRATQLRRWFTERKQQLIEAEEAGKAR